LLFYDAVKTQSASGFILVLLLLPLGGIAAASEDSSPQEVITRLVTNAHKKPPGPVENDISSEVLKGEAGLLEMTRKSDPSSPPASLREAAASDYNFFTLEAPLSRLYSNGKYSLFSAPIKLSDALLRNRDDLSLNPDGRPGFGPGVGGAMYLMAKVKTDGYVVATFCFVSENGVWKAHNFYISNGPLDDQQKNGLFHIIESYTSKP
jgi:hypothetical protein